MSLQMVRFRTDQGNAAQVRSALDDVFAALRAAAPEGLRYTAYEHGSGSEYVLVLELDEGVANVLLDLPEAGRLRDSVARWAGGPVPPQPFAVVGSYAP